MTVTLFTSYSMPSVYLNRDQSQRTWIILIQASVMRSKEDAQIAKQQEPHVGEVAQLVPGCVYDYSFCNNHLLYQVLSFCIVILTSFVNDIQSCLQTLCNACGIRQRKKRRALLGFDKGGPERSREKMAKGSNSSKLGVSLNLGLMGFKRDGMFQEDWKIKLGEEEQAAILLMALSCGSVCPWYKKDEGKHFYP